MIEALYNNFRFLNMRLHTICAAHDKYNLIPWEVFLVKQATQRSVGFTQAKITYKTSMFINDERQRHATIHSRRKQKSSIGT